MVTGAGGNLGSKLVAHLVGLPWVENGDCYNACALLDAGRIEAVRFKVDLPNYGVFDEKRVFACGPMPGPVAFRGVRLGLPICEDIWGEDVVECLAETGAEILLVPNGSPYWRGKHDERVQIACTRVTEAGMPLVYLNQIGGQDELVFDGGSFVLNADCSLAAQLPAMRETIACTVWERGSDGWRCIEGPRALLGEGDEADYAACVLGLRDYVDKNRFPGVVMGLSGGIDSALCAAMAVDALGPERVHCVMLPYRLRQRAGPALRHALHCACGRGDRGGARAAVRRPPARHHRRKSAEPRARHPAHVDLKQVRPHAGDHRQQVGDERRLCHDLW